MTLWATTPHLCPRRKLNFQVPQSELWREDSFFPLEGRLAVLAQAGLVFALYGSLAFNF